MKKGYKKIYTQSEFMAISEARKAKLAWLKPPIKTWDEQELEARCELSKPNFNRACQDKQREIRARAMSRKLGRWL